MQQQCPESKLACEVANTRYYWSPGVRWEINVNAVKIEIFSYKDFVVDLFPKFYFLTQKGISIENLLEEFSNVDHRKVNRFINDLIKKRVLVSSITTPHEVFFTQSCLFQNDYSEKIICDASELTEFKEKQLQRNCAPKSARKIPLKNTEFPDWISQRRSYRIFNTEARIDYDTFSKLFSIFKQQRDDYGIRYYYASAGGLYPIDIYVYVKDGRVESVGKGLYYYSPVDNSLNLINETCNIIKDAHYFTNQSIFEQSAFSIFLVFNAEATMPKYGGMAYFYACVDSGIMVNSLTVVGELNNIGLCSIGDMQFGKIEKYFQLNRNQVFLHSIEVGLKPNVKE